MLEVESRLKNLGCVVPDEQNYSQEEIDMLTELQTFTVREPVCPLRAAHSRYILVTGCSKLELAHPAANLAKATKDPVVVFTGKYGHLSKGLLSIENGETEADRMNHLAWLFGYKGDRVLERESQHCGDNIIKGRTCLLEEGYNPSVIEVVCQPFAQSRIYQVGKLHLTGVDLYFFTPELVYSFCQLVNYNLGEITRHEEYPSKGFQAWRDIPQNVLDIRDELRSRNYSERAIKPLNI